MFKHNKILAFSGFELDLKLNLSSNDLHRHYLSKLECSEDYLVLFKIDEIVEKMTFLPKNNILTLLTLLNKTLVMKYVIDIKLSNILDKFNKFPLFSKKVKEYFKSNMIYFSVYSTATKSKIRLDISVDNSQSFHHSLHLEKNTDFITRNESKTILKPIDTVFPQNSSDIIFIDYEEILNNKLSNLGTREVFTFLSKSNKNGSKIVSFFPSTKYINLEDSINLIELINISNITIYDINPVLKFCEVIGHKAENADKLEFNFVKRFYFPSNKKKISLFFDDFIKLTVILEKKNTQQLKEKHFHFNLGFKYDYKKIFEESNQTLKYSFLAGFLSSYFNKQKLKTCFQAGITTFNKMLRILETKNFKLLEDKDHFQLPYIPSSDHKEEAKDKKEFVLDCFNFKPIVYEPLADSNLTNYFSKKVVKKQLKRNGIIQSINSKYRDKSLKVHFGAFIPTSSDDYLSRGAFLRNLTHFENNALNNSNTVKDYKLSEGKDQKVKSLKNQFKITVNKKKEKVVFKEVSVEKKPFQLSENQIYKEEIHEKIDKINAKIANLKETSGKTTVPVKLDLVNNSEEEETENAYNSFVEKMSKEGIYVPKNSEVIVEEEKKMLDEEKEKEAMREIYLKTNKK